jgi:hypothetical protein
MKFLATKKQMREEYFTIISIGYCDAQNLLHYENPIAYSAGQSGWACDYYDVNCKLISTGYSPLKDAHATTNYETLLDYDKKAREITYSNEYLYEEKKTLVHDLLLECIAKFM